jgi:hypothetical protein
MNSWHKMVRGLGFFLCIVSKIYLVVTRFVGRAQILEASVTSLSG